MNPPGAPWALRLAPGDATAAAALRLVPGVEACRGADGLWLRGPAPDPGLKRMLALLPGERFTGDAAGHATPHGRLLPVAQLPYGPWTPVAEACAPQAEPAALPGAMPERVTLRLVADGAERPCTALVCAWDDWTHWADTAPALRLAPLRFARCGPEALVVGAPLPALPGLRCHQDGPLLLPAGTTLMPACSAATARHVFRLAEGELALLGADGAWDVVPAATLLTATRANVRATARGAESR